MSFSEIVKGQIKELAQFTSEEKYLFLNEHDFHHVFFKLAYDKLKKIKKQDFLHPEYPTFHRLELKTDKKPYYYAISQTAKRGHYDFVVFSEDFYNNPDNDFNRISNKKVNTLNDEKKPYLDLAIEFKYFIDKIDLNSINLDITKLDLAVEAKEKILVIFYKGDIPNIKTDVNNLKNKSVIIYIYHLPKINNLNEEINKQKWTSAKTYVKTAPHEYIVDKQNPELFKTICGMIDKEGYYAEFTLFGNTKTYKYLKIGNYKYWHIDNILNRNLIHEENIKLKM
jgi:hypothetical protein